MELSESKYVGASIKVKQQRLYTLCHDYLIDNFSNFSETNKIKIALVLTSKMAPQQIEGQYSVTKLDKIKIDDKELEYDIGNRIGQLAECAPEATASN